MKLPFDYETGEEFQWKIKTLNNDIMIVNRRFTTLKNSMEYSNDTLIRKKR